jgi:hypothetical protein
LPSALALLLGSAALANAEGAEVIQKGDLLVSSNATMRPQSLPRKGVAPISVSLAGRVSTTDESQPPQLRKLQVEINRHGRFDYRGLPVCRIGRIQPASNSRALSACRSSLVGRGKFSGAITLPGSAPYPIEGGLLLFNGRQHGKQVLFGHIYAAKPFITSFVIIFQISTLRHGTYGTLLSANLAQALGQKRNLTGIEMTLSRRYSYRGARHSYLSAGCPAPKGFGAVPFALARTTFDFAGGRKMTSTLTQQCRVRG